MMATGIFVAMALFVQPWCPLGAADTCSSGSCDESSSPKSRRGEQLLQRFAHADAIHKHVVEDRANETIATEEDEGMVSHAESQRRGGCSDLYGDAMNVEWYEPPADVWQKGNPYGADQKCEKGVDWPKSDWIMQVLKKAKVKDTEQFVFRVCWDRNADPEKRWFPWAYTMTGDWTNTLVVQGSVILRTEDIYNTWLPGAQQLLPEALDYYARMGEVLGRKIIPKFMLYGWSKGASVLFPIGKERPDIVQGVVPVHGCDYKYEYSDERPKKALKSYGVVPYLFISSKNDGYLDCTYGNTKKIYDKYKAQQPFTRYAESPCGHHPEKCHPVCDLNISFTQPFWSFVNKAYKDTDHCSKFPQRERCEDVLCQWDDDLKYCTNPHPVEMTPSCERFCTKTLVETCDGLSTDVCGESYTVLSVEVADANGMHSVCKVGESGACEQSESSFQCFFQDQC